MSSGSRVRLLHATSNQLVLSSAVPRAQQNYMHALCLLHTVAAYISFFVLHFNWTLNKLYRNNDIHMHGWFLIHFSIFSPMQAKSRCSCMITKLHRRSQRIYPIIWKRAYHTQQTVFYLMYSHSFSDLVIFLCKSTYSGEKKYLVSHQLCKFSHLKR